MNAYKTNYHHIFTQKMVCKSAKKHFEKTAAKDTQLDEDGSNKIPKIINFIVNLVILKVSLLKKTCYVSKIYQNLKNVILFTKMNAFHVSPESSLALKYTHTHIHTGRQ